jgi:hypothetical protein
MRPWLLDSRISIKINDKRLCNGLLSYHSDSMGQSLLRAGLQEQKDPWSGADVYVSSCSLPGDLNFTYEVIVRFPVYLIVPDELLAILTPIQLRLFGARTLASIFISVGHPGRHNPPGGVVLAGSSYADITISIGRSLCVISPPNEIIVHVANSRGCTSCPAVGTSRVVVVVCALVGNPTSRSAFCRHN